MMKGFFTSIFGASDEQAMWRVKTDDDAEAFAHLVRKWEKPIQRLCARMTCDVHKGEDLAQEAFARLYAKRKDYQPSGKFSTYLWRVALNVTYDELRRRKRHPEAELSAGWSEEAQAVDKHAVEEVTPAESLAQSETADKVRGAVAALPEHYRAVLVLRHYEDLKFHEIAEVLSIPEGTVKSRMSYALSQLQQQLAKDFAATRAPKRPESLMI